MEGNTLPPGNHFPLELERLRRLSEALDLTGFDSVSDIVRQIHNLPSKNKCCDWQGCVRSAPVKKNVRFSWSGGGGLLGGPGAGALPSVFGFGFVLAWLRFRFLPPRP